MRRVRIVECGLFSAVARPQNPAGATPLASFVPILPSQRQRCRAPALGRLTVQHHDAHAMPLIGTTSSQDERPQTNTFPVKGGGPVNWRTYSTRAVQCAPSTGPPSATLGSFRSTNHLLAHGIGADFRQTGALKTRWFGSTPESDPTASSVGANLFFPRSALPHSHPRASAVFVDVLDAGRLTRNDIKRRAKRLTYPGFKLV